MRSILWTALVSALFGPYALGEQQWERSSPDGVTLRVQVGERGSLNYSVSMGDVENPWLLSSTRARTPRIFCDGAWHNFSTAATHVVWNATEDAMWVAYDDGEGPRFNASFEYHSDAGGHFVLRQSFPDGCANSSGLHLPTMAGSSYNSSSLPLSEFPAFDYSHGSRLRGELGYVTWAGVFAYTRASQGIGLSGYIGGQEGGPIVLFQTGQRNRSALVISPYAEFMSSVLALRPATGGSAAANGSNACCDSSSFETDIDYTGHDFSGSMRRGVPSAAACCAMCAQDSVCRYFSWIGRNGTDPDLANNCYMKWSTAGRRVARGHVSGGACPQRPMDLVAGVQGRVASLPAGHEASFIIAGSAGKGVRPAMEKWGRALRTRHNTSRSPLGTVERKISYWTDNGAYYFGRNKPTAQQLAGAVNQARAQGIPLQSVQLDPWAQNMCNFTPFTDLDSLSHSIGGLNFTVYSFFFCPEKSRDYFRLPFLRSVEFEKGQFAQVAPNASFALYDRLMSERAGLMAMFEVDFLSYYALLVPEFFSTVDAARDWAAGMHRAASKHGTNIQYCMPLPAWLLQSLEFSSVTNARASGDNFPSNDHRWRIAYTSLLHQPLHLRPFFDVAWTRDEEPGNTYPTNRTDIALQLAVAALSSGPVGIGDGPGMADPVKAARVCARDGTLLRPSVPATPIDAMLDGDRSPSQWDGTEPEVWDAASVVDELVYWSVLVVDLPGGRTVRLDELYVPEEVQPSGWSLDKTKYWVCNLGACRAGNKTTSCATLAQGLDGSFQARTEESGDGDEHAFTVLTLAPLCESGAALLGERGKYVASSPDRFRRVECTPDGVRVTLAPSLPGENVTLVFDVGGTISLQSVTQPSQGGAVVECRTDTSSCT